MLLLKGMLWKIVVLKLIQIIILSQIVFAQAASEEPVPELYVEEGDVQKAILVDTRFEFKERREFRYDFRPSNDCYLVVLLS
jgi:hypothetical protein